MQLVALVEPADGFLLAGFKQRKIRLVPFMVQTLTYTCVPIQAGTRPLPLLRLVAAAAQDDSAAHAIGPFTTTVL